MDTAAPASWAARSCHHLRRARCASWWRRPWLLPFSNAIVRAQTPTPTKQKFLALRSAALDDVGGADSSDMAWSVLGGGEQAKTELAADGETVDELRCDVSSMR